MTTFDAAGHKTETTAPEAAPAEEQLDVPPEFCATDEEVGGEDIDPAVIATVTDISTDAATDPRQPEVVDAEPEVVEQPGTAVALAERFDLTTTDEVWPYDFLEFKGDKLGIRLPTRQALAAFSLASSKYVSLGVKNDLTGLFIARHLSPESYGRVFSRLMDPDENDYTVDTVGELFNAIVTASIDADKADNAG